MRVGDQHQVNRRQVIQVNAGVPHALHHFQPKRPDRVDQQIQAAPADQERGVPDPGEANVVALKDGVRRPSRIAAAPRKERGQVNFRDEVTAQPPPARLEPNGDSLVLMLCRHAPNGLSYSAGMATTPISKAHLRQKLRAQLARMPAEERRAASLAICERLIPFIRQAGIVALFAPRPDEPDLKLLDPSGLWLGRTILFPRLEGSTPAFAPAAGWAELQPGKFGLLAPIRPASSLTPHLVIVPGLAFNRRGDRLGRGAGFYDRYLAGLDTAVTTVGVAFHLQLIDALPREDHDFRVRTVLTEHETIEVTGGG